MYIEPCCVGRQLPNLLRENAGNVVFFQTSGDVTIAQFMEAVSCMVQAPYVMLLQVPEIDEATLKTIRYYFQRDWQGGLLLLTHDDQSEQVKTILADYLDRIQYAYDPLVADGQIAFARLTTDGISSVIIQGAMLGAKDFSLSLYAGYCGYSCQCAERASINVWRSATSAAIAKLRTRPTIKATHALVTSVVDYH